MKRLYLVTVLIFLLTTNLNARQPKPNADSLLKILASYRHDDTIRVKTMVEYFKCLFPSDMDSAHRWSLQIISLSEKLNYKTGIVRGLNSKALSEWYGKDPSLAVPTFNQALSLVMTMKSADLQSLITNNFGVYYMQMGVNDSAEKYLLLAQNISKKLPDQARYAKNAGDLSMIYFNKGKYIEAINSLLEAQNYYITARKQFELIVNLNRLSMIYQDLGDFDNALQALNDARKGNADLKDKNMEITINLNLGVLYTTVKSNPDSASLYLNKAKEMAEKTQGEELALVLSLINLGNVAINTKDYQKALDYYTKANESPLLKGRLREQTVVMVNLAEAYQHLGQNDKAAQYANAGIRLARANGFKKFEKIGYDVLASISFNLKEYLLAYKYKLKGDSLRESILNEDIKQKVTEATFRMALHQKEIENISLQKENKIQTQTIFIQYLLIAGTGMILLLVIILAAVIYRNQQRQRKMNKELDLLNKQLTESNLTKEKFLSIIAHDLKSPFNGLLGFLTELDEYYDDFDETMRHDIIHKLKISSRNTFSLVENLLTWSQSQKGRIECNPVQFNLGTAVEAVFAILASRADAKNQSLKMSVDPNITVYTDANILKAILINLVNNSIKFSGKNSEINVNAALADKALRIEIVDQGMGIPADQLSKLFRIDSQFKRKGTDNEPGTGLGLIMCHEYMTLLNGTISVESKVGEGSRFTLTFPENMVISGATKADSPRQI